MENGGGASSRDKPVARTHVEIDLHESLGDALAAFSNLAYLASKQAEDAEQVRLYHGRHLHRRPQPTHFAAYVNQATPSHSHQQHLKSL